jgi:hypothetical protein
MFFKSFAEKSENSSEGGTTPSAKIELSGICEEQRTLDSFAKDTKLDFTEIVPMASNDQSTTPSFRDGESKPEVFWHTSMQKVLEQTVDLIFPNKPSNKSGYSDFTTSKSSTSTPGGKSLAAMKPPVIARNPQM